MVTSWTHKNEQRYENETITTYLFSWVYAEAISTWFWNEKYLCVCVCVFFFFVNSQSAAEYVKRCRLAEEKTTKWKKCHLFLKRVENVSTATTNTFEISTQICKTYVCVCVCRAPYKIFKLRHGVKLGFNFVWLHDFFKKKQMLFENKLKTKYWRVLKSWCRTQMNLGSSKHI